MDNASSMSTNQKCVLASMSSGFLIMITSPGLKEIQTKKQAA